MTIASHWHSICDQIATVSAQQTEKLQNQPVVGCTRSPIRIVSTVAVSKRQPVDFIQQAYNAGARNFGESFLQEALPKIEQLNKYKDIVWHFIGPVQSNKTPQIANNFDWVQSVSREKIAQRLSRHRSENKPSLNILIQVNISHEASKSGLAPNQLEKFADIIESLPRLALRGLMCIPEKTNDAKEQTDMFKLMAQLFEEARSKHPSMDTLSMGMSNDYATAIACGSNMVRIGSALFGLRE